MEMFYDIEDLFGVVYGLYILEMGCLVCVIFVIDLEGMLVYEEIVLEVLLEFDY